MGLAIVIPVVVLMIAAFGIMVVLSVVALIVIGICSLFKKSDKP